MQQLAEILVRCNPIRGLAEGLVSALAVVHTFPSKQEVIADAAADNLDKDDWMHFCKYSDMTSPHATCHADYPICPLEDQNQSAPCYHQCTDLRRGIISFSCSEYPLAKTTEQQSHSSTQSCIHHLLFHAEPIT